MLSPSLAVMKRQLLSSRHIRSCNMCTYEAKPPISSYSRVEPGEPESYRHNGDICFCQTALGLILMEHRCHQKQMSQHSWMNRPGLQQSADFHPSLACGNTEQSRYAVFASDRFSRQASAGGLDFILRALLVPFQLRLHSRDLLKNLFFPLTYINSMF